MSDVNISCSLAAAKDNLSASLSKTTALTMAGDEIISSTVTVGTVVEQLSLGDIATSPGYFMGVNNDATNYVEFFYDQAMAKPICKALAGEPFLVPLSEAAVWARANTASCIVSYGCHKR